MNMAAIPSETKRAGPYRTGPQRHPALRKRVRGFNEMRIYWMEFA